MSDLVPHKTLRSADVGQLVPTALQSRPLACRALCRHLKSPRRTLESRATIPGEVGVMFHRSERRTHPKMMVEWNLAGTAIVDAESDQDMIDHILQIGVREAAVLDHRV
jgi:hypothetical protein